MAKKANKTKDEVVEETTKVETVETVETPIEEVIADCEDVNLEFPIQEIPDEPQAEAIDRPIGNPDPVTGEPHDCITGGQVRSISVGGKRMSQCGVCGTRF